MDATVMSETDLHDELRQLVLARGYERREQPFPLSSGGMSHDYVDMRRAVARGADLRTAGLAVVSALARHGVVFDAIGGMTMGADPVAHAVALLTDGSWYSVRKAVKDHGRQQRVEGATIGPGVRVVVIEDTVSTGRSLFDAYEVVRDTGAEIVAACTILDRGEAIAPRFAELGVPYVAVLSYRDLGIEPIGAGEANSGEASAGPAGPDTSAPSTSG
ncbi:MAG: phosphoribosyltransferase family protein [Acidimicrobiales bacterium]|jgi:orotate phosphoribosyltransferase